MLTESCVVFFCFCFVPFCPVLSALLREEYLTSVARTKQGDMAGSNQQPVRDLVHFKPEPTQNQWNSHI